MQEKIDINDIQNDEQSLVITKLVVQLCISELNNLKEFINTNPSTNPSREEDRSKKNQTAYSEFFDHFSSDEHDVHLEEMLGACQEWCEHHRGKIPEIPAQSLDSPEACAENRRRMTNGIDGYIGFLEASLENEASLVELRDHIRHDVSFGVYTSPK